MTDRKPVRHKKMQCLVKKCLTMPKKCFATPLEVSLEVSPNTFLENTMSDAIGERCEVEKRVWRFLE